MEEGGEERCELVGCGGGGREGGGADTGEVEVGGHFESSLFLPMKQQGGRWIFLVYFGGGASGRKGR